MWMGLREYGRHRKAEGLIGHTLAAVQKAIRTGRIQAVEGKIDSEAADRAWAERSDPAKAPAPPPAPLLDGTPLQAPAELARRVEWPDMGPWPPPVVRPPEPEVVALPENVTGMDTFLAAKTDRERAEAELAKIRLLEARGRLVDAEEARQTWQAIGAMFARAREVVPVALATRLVNKSDPKEIERIIRAEFREADRKIADEIETRFGMVGDVRSLAS